MVFLGLVWFRSESPSTFTTSKIGAFSLICGVGLLLVAVGCLLFVCGGRGSLLVCGGDGSLLVVGGCCLLLAWL